MRSMILNRKGQSTLEYIVYFTIILAVFISIQTYFKRGVQGRWKAHIDELGDQYDPRTANTNLRETLSSSTNTSIVTMNTIGGFWTKRTDVSVSSERKTGYTTVGSY